MGCQGRHLHWSPGQVLGWWAGWGVPGEPPDGPRVTSLYQASWSQLMNLSDEGGDWVIHSVNKYLLRPPVAILGTQMSPKK